MRLRSWCGLLGLLGLLCACATPQATQTARDTWYELRTPRFVLWTDGDPALAHALLADLERFHQVALATTSAEEVEAAPPVRVFVAKDRASFVALTHGSSTLHGLFVASLWGNYAIVDGSSLESDAQTMGGRAVLFHEYTHYMLAVRGARVPSWYNEGLAEYMSTTEFGAEGSYTLGCPPHYRVAWTQFLSWLPLRRVLSADNLEATVSKHAMTDGYAQSWYLVHYFSANAERKQQLSAYLKLWAEGAPQDDAVQRGFGMSVDQLDALLQRYSREPAFDCLTIKSAEPLIVPKIEQRVLTASEAHHHIGDLLLASFGPTDAALDVLKQSARIEPNAPLTLLAFGRAHWLRAELGQGDVDAALQEAERYLQQARARGGDSADALALEGHVQRVISARAAAAKHPYSEALVAARKAYRAAIRKDETCTEAYVGLGKTYLIEDNGSAEAQVTLEAAAYLLPLDTEIALTLARIQIARHNTLQAVPALEYVLRWSKDERTRAAAKTALDAVHAEAVNVPSPPTPAAASAPAAPPAPIAPAAPAPAASAPAAPAPQP